MGWLLSDECKRDKPLAETGRKRPNIWYPSAYAIVGIRFRTGCADIPLGKPIRTGGYNVRPGLNLSRRRGTLWPQPPRTGSAGVSPASDSQHLGRGTFPFMNRTLPHLVTH